MPGLYIRPCDSPKQTLIRQNNVSVSLDSPDNLYKVRLAYSGKIRELLLAESTPDLTYRGVVYGSRLQPAEVQSVCAIVSSKWEEDLAGTSS